MTPLLCQAFTGHGGIAEYLHRFKLRSSPGCECDPNISETVEHIILDCPRFAAARWDTENRIDTTLTKQTLHLTLSNSDKRDYFLKYIENAFRIATKRNSSLTPEDAALNQTAATQDHHLANPSTGTPDRSRTEADTTTLNRLLSFGERGEPGIRLRSVALFMDTNMERLGIGFCNANARGRVVLSPGLAALINGSTSKNTMKRRTYDALPETTIAQNRCRLVRSKNKTIALFQWNYLVTPFTQASSVLQHLGGMDAATQTRISVDAMAVGYERGEVDNYLGCIEASKRHEVVVYENRGEDLSFLKPKPSPTETPSQSGPTTSSVALSGSERLQQKRAEAATPKTPRVIKETKSALKYTCSALAAQICSITGGREKIKAAKHTAEVGTALQQFTSPTRSKPTTSQGPAGTRKTRAEMGQVQPPALRDVRVPLDHVINAFLEFQAITKAEQEVSLRTCEEIMQAYLLGNTGLLKVRLGEAEASIYDNNTSQNIMGEETGAHMTAYSATGGFVELDESATGPDNPPKFKTPPHDPVVVIARCTRIMLNEKILERAKTIAGSENESLELWETPKFTWVNGVPGCGKTTWIVRNFDPINDIVITTTTEAAKDLREKLEPRLGLATKHKVRTMASVLVNGMKEPGNRLMVDEALMNHFGAIVMATKLAGASETLLIGDKNQLPFIDRNNLFRLQYCRPNHVARVNTELLCTHRNPMDVAFALREVYDGIYASKSQVRSLELKRYTGSRIPKDAENTLYLTHTQGEKELLKAEGYGSGTGSRVNTIHEAQGATFETVIIVRINPKKIQLHDSVSHAVVAVSRHTKCCTYYTDDSSDATAHFISKAEHATASQIREYNIKMAIRNGDGKVVAALTNTKA